MESSQANQMIGVKEKEYLRTIYEVNNALNAIEEQGSTMEEILPDILEVTLKTLNGNIGSIIMVNPDSLKVENTWLYNTKYPSIYTSSDLDDIVEFGLAGLALRTQETVVVDNQLTDSRWYQRSDHSQVDIWSAICSPILARQQSIGVFTLLKAGEKAINSYDIMLLEEICERTAHMLEHVRLQTESRRQLQFASLLHEASHVINASLELEEIMQRLLTKMNEFLHAEAVSIALVDKESNELVYQAAEGVGSDKIIGLRLPSNQGLSGWVMEHSQPGLVPDTNTDARFSSRLGDKRTGYKTKAMICAPLIFKGAVLGTIQAINPLEGNFKQQDLDVLVSLANIASSSIAHAQQFARTQEAEARYMGLFQDSVDPIILTELNGEIVEANQRAIEFFGYHRFVLLEMNIKELHTAPIDYLLTENQASEEVQIFVSHVSMQQRRRLLHVEVYVKLVNYSQGQLLQWIHHDITKQVELDEMRQDLTAMLVHDLQSPLGNVISSLELIRNDFSDVEDPTLAAMLDIAVRSSNHLQTLVHSLMDISRLEAGYPIAKKERINLHTLVDQVYDIEQPNFDKRGVTFVREIESDLPDICVEVNMTRRVFLNLIDNALKYSQDNRQVKLSARKGEQSGMVLISICDEGQGIPLEYREIIFEKFQRIKTTSASKGLGLGLAFCRLAVEAHNGRIWVDDGPNGGARFNLTLPEASSPDSE